MQGKRMKKSDRDGPCRLPLLLLLFLGAVFLVGCHTLRFLTVDPGTDRPDNSDKEQTASAGLPGRYHLRSSSYVFFSDFELKADQPIFAELATMRDQVYKELQLPGGSTLVQVYIFEDRDRYERFMRAKYPDLPRRRAFFVAQPRSVGGAEDLLVYTYWGDRVREDLRHELTHALLHSVLKDVPLWLDEGLAEYYELPPEQRGVNFKHLDQLRHGPGEPFKPDLARLEQLSQVQQMTPPEYREAWAWVHLMLAGRPEARAVLLAYLQQLRATSNPGLLQPRLAAAVPNLDEALDKHLARLDSAPRPAPLAQH